MIRINREAKVVKYEPEEKTLKEQCTNNLAKLARENCNKEVLRNRAKVTFLSFPTQLVGYQWRTLASDTIAGLTVAFVRLPQGMAYALLAGLPPQYGLYENVVNLTSFGAHIPK